MGHRPHNYRSGLSAVGRGAEYTPEELEFLRAIDRLKRRRPQPTWLEVLNVLKELGYQKETR